MVNYTVKRNTIAKKRRLILNTFAESGVINAVLRKCLIIFLPAILGTQN